MTGVAGQRFEIERITETENEEDGTASISKEKPSILPRIDRDKSPEKEKVSVLANLV